MNPTGSKAPWMHSTMDDVFIDDDMSAQDFADLVCLKYREGYERNVGVFNGLRVRHNEQIRWLKSYRHREAFLKAQS